MEKIYTIIINPVAGKGAGKKTWEAIDLLLKDRMIGHTFYFTENHSGTHNYCLDQINLGARNFIVIGGDGTMNEVANAILGQAMVDPKDFTFSVIPVGKGNDWCRSFNIPFDYASAFDVICKGNFMFQDVGKVSFLVDGEKQSRYFINVAGMGFDAFVADRITQKASKGSAFTYLWNLLISLFKYKSTEIKLNYDDKTFSSQVFSMSVGIGKFNGGGMMQLPNAVPNDGFFDLTIINNMGKFELIRNIKRLYDGSIIDHPKIDAFRARKIILESSPNIKIELDGEVCGASPFEFEIIQECLRVGVP
jgi:YegS/Rv2252/BmrU family lipid kinase